MDGVASIAWWSMTVRSWAGCGPHRKMAPGASTYSVLRNGKGFVPTADTVIDAGDEVLLVLDPGLEERITSQFTPNGGAG